MKRWIRRILILALVVIAGFALRHTVFKKDPVDVTVFRVAEGRVEDSVTNSKAGTVATRRRAAISPEIGGRVGELLVREGDRVAEGQILMRLVDEDYRARIDLSDRAREVAAGHRARSLSGPGPGGARPGAIPAAPRGRDRLARAAGSAREPSRRGRGSLRGHAGRRSRRRVRPRRWRGSSSPRPCSTPPSTASSPRCRPRSASGSRRRLPGCRSRR